MVEDIRLQKITDRLDRLERSQFYSQKLLDELGNGNTGQLLNTDSAELFKFDWVTGGLVYGGISRLENTVETAIAITSTPVQITVFDTNNPSNLITPDHTNDHLTIGIAGDYLILVSAVIESITGAGSVAELEVYKNNGVAMIDPLHADRQVTGGGGDTGSVSLTGIATLALNDTIEVWITNETNTQNYIVEDIILSLLLVGS